MNTENNVSEPERGTFQRSAAYPAITIAKALEFTEQVKKAFQASLFTRDDIARVLSKPTISRDVAAAVHYGLFEKTIGSGYRLAPLSKSILTPLSDEERQEGLLECFKKPKLYADLIEKYKGRVLPPEAQFRAVLSRQHNITESAAPHVAEVFIQNATYVGLLNSYGVFSDTKQVESVKEEAITSQESYTQKFESVTQKDFTHSSPQMPETSQPVASQPNPIAEKPPLMLEEMNGAVNIEIRLTEKKKAHLIYPETMNEKDIRILKLQLESIALTLGIEIEQ